MPRYRLLDLTDPEPGRNEEFNDRYERVVEAVVQTPGSLRGQRLEATAPGVGVALRTGLKVPDGAVSVGRWPGPQQRYLTIYEIEVESLQDALTASANRGSVLLSGHSFDTGNVAMWAFGELSDPIERR